MSKRRARGLVSRNLFSFCYDRFNVVRSLRVAQGSSVHSVRLWSLWVFIQWVFDLSLCVFAWVFSHPKGPQSFNGSSAIWWDFGHSVRLRLCSDHSMGLWSCSGFSVSQCVFSLSKSSVRSSVTHGVFGHSTGSRSHSGSSVTQQGVGQLVGFRSLGGSSVIQWSLSGSSVPQCVFSHSVGLRPSSALNGSSATQWVFGDTEVLRSLSRSSVTVCGH